MKSSETAAKLLLTVCVLVIVRKASGCEQFWNRYGDHCFRIYLQNRTSYSAELRCHLEGSKLASISDTSTLEFLSQHVAQYPQTKFWVGLKRRNGELQWLDGTEDVQNQSWVKIPENYEFDHHDLGCFAYNGTMVTKYACYLSFAYICGHHISSDKKATSCNPIYSAFFEHSFKGDVTGNCLFRPSNLSTKDKVDATCQLFHGHFVDFDAMVVDGLTAFFEHEVIPNDESKYWTSFLWNGTNLLRSNGEALPEHYPISVVEGSGSCVSVQFNFTDILSTKFYQTDCNQSAHVVCSYDISKDQPSTTTRRSHENFISNSGENCPEGYNWKADRSKNYCYWETSFETDQLSWDDAEKYCRGYDGHLASFHSIEEEKIGLSFQYGSLAHDYWIGLRFDPVNETYTWTDGSALEYTNWAPGHPDHKDQRLKCVSMNAADKHWTSSLCGILSWFICKVPKKLYHPSPFVPTPTPLEPCENSPFAGKSSWYFKGACYFPVVESHSWHRAKLYCENIGGNLVSIHSTEEIGFLLRLLHDSAMETNRVWIGLNSFGSDGNFLWTDWTAVDFTYFASNEPDNFQNQEKCCNMNTRDGQWNDENCNAAFGFICKRMNDTCVSTVIPSTQDPRIGNCKNGWIAHNDRCYYVGGRREKDRVNWTEAKDFCQKNGAYLTSIRDINEQNFLAYLLQTIGEDAWIGLHDTIQSGRYYWLDNSDLQYTNWSPGEPSFFGIMEDCVKMVYDHLNSGVWKDDECHRNIGFICQSSKDAQLPAPASDRGMNCVHPEGWLKLDTMCFKMFEGHFLTWQEAEHECNKAGGHLVSISDQKVKAVVTYLASEVNQPFFIGLKYDKNSQTIKWLNNFPVRLSNWEKNEPSRMTENSCFASTAEGYWKKYACDEELPYLCQITTGKPKKLNRFIGECPPSTKLWSPGSSSYCYVLNNELRSDWFTANIMCFRYGSHLISIHSKEELEDIKKLVKPGIRSIFLGLMRNKKDGFAWTDDTPLNFENWDEGEPANSEDQCVEMSTHNMKWSVTTCFSKKHFICMDTKGTLIKEEPEASEYAAEYEGLPAAVICLIFFSIVVVIALIVGAIYYYRRTYRVPQFRRQERDTSVSFENALYDVGNSSMAFSDENRS